MAGGEEQTSQQIVKGSETNSKAAAPWENSNHPLFLHYSDQPGAMLVSEPLGEDNYPIWAPSIMMALEIKNKAGFITGTLTRSTINQEEGRQWDRCNTLVKNWLISSMTKNMSKSVIHRKEARTIWLELQERFDQTNSVALFRIENNIHKCEQGSRSVTSYYTDLKGMWDEKDVLCSFPACSCETAAEVTKFMETQKTMKFLMGLNESFEQTRGNIIGMDPLPSLSKTYAIVLRQEKQSQVTTDKTTPIPESAAFSIPGFGRESSFAEREVVDSSINSVKRGNRDVRRPEGGGRYCEKCDMTNHSTKYCRAHITCSYCNLKGHPQPFPTHPQVRRSTRATKVPATLHDFHVEAALPSRTVPSSSPDEVVNPEHSFFRDGLMTPLTMFVLSGVINEYGAATLTFSNDIVDKYSLKLFYVAIGVGISAFTEGVCWTRTAERQTSRMRMEYLKSVLRQDVAFFDSQANSSITFQVISTISSDAHLIQDTIAEKLPNCLAHLSSFLFCFPVAFLLSWRLALAALPLSVMFIIPGLGFGKVMQDLGLKINGAYGVAGGIAEQAISSIRTVYSYVGEHQTLKKFSISLEKVTQLGIKQGFTKGLLIGSMGMIYAAWAFQAWVGSKLIIERDEKGGLVFVSGICVILGGLAIMNTLPNLSFITQASTAASRISEMINRIPAIDSEDEKGKVLPYVKGDIEFRNVDFFYPSRPDTPILQGLSLKVQAGKMVGLVGSSGSGKSTIISLVERFYDPVKGDIHLDGHKLKKFQLHWLRSQMGLVNQEPILFATSIKENILFGKEGAAMEHVISAAKAANAHDFIVKLPAGYHTQVGQFGVQLSGGQKQRISIARAIIRDPKILLLDEATSALDAQSETIVQEALDQASQGRTTIVIAHRLTTIRKADMIAVLQSGRVVEKGSHDQLVNMKNGEGGAYKKMLQLQQQAMLDGNPNKMEQPQTPRTPKSLGSSWQNSPAPLSGRSSWHTPKSVHSSWQSSPAYAVTPIFSISIANSIQTHQYDDFDDEWSDEISKTSSLQWRLFQMNAPEWKQAILGCLGAAGFGTLQPIHAYCLGTIVSVYYETDNSTIKSHTRFYCYIFLGIAVFSFFANLLQHYNFAVMGERLSERVRTKLLEKILTFEIGWFDQDENTSAAICARLTTEANMVRSLTADRISLLVQVFFSASIAFILGLIVTWRIAIVMIAIQPLLIGSFYSRSVLMKSMSRKAQKAQAVGSQLASEATFNHRTITAFSSQTRILNLFQDAMQGPRKENIKQSWVAGFGLFSSQFFTTAAIALTYWYGGRLMNQNLVSSTHLFQVFFILMSTGKNIADAGIMTSDLARSGKAISSIFAILDRESEISSEELKGVKKTFKGHIELKNVVFSYPVRPNQMIFKGLNLKIKAGNSMALVGQSGSGKSTVIGLIERFYDPLNGSVFIDGCDIRQYNLRSLRSQIALVSQEPTLFGGTIYENIVYGKENATVAEVRKAAKQANAHEFISSMENGYDTYCGERGVQLSGGQKQRIALARAILKNPTILLLDEATSALDSVSENLVQEALEKMMVGRTCVVVAHRLSTIQKANSIAVIMNGKVAEQGSHSELVSIGSGGAYYSLIKLQSNQAITA